MPWVLFMNLFICNMDVITLYNSVCFDIHGLLSRKQTKNCGQVQKRQSRMDQYISFFMFRKLNNYDEEVSDHGQTCKVTAII